MRLVITRRDPGHRFVVFIGGDEFCKIDSDGDTNVVIDRIVDGVGNVSIDTSVSTFSESFQDGDSKCDQKIRMEFFYSYESNAMKIEDMFDLILQRIFEEFNLDSMIVDRNRERVVYERKE
ncbi:hypothetical protein ACFL08_04385 [Patescibacteria group bacterium]